MAGNGTTGYTGDGGPATSAEFYFPAGVAVDSAGNLYIADDANNRIRKVDANGIITTVAGTGPSGAFGTGGYSGDGGPATSAELFEPNGLAVDGAGNLYIADTANGRIRKVTVSTGIITTVAGGGAGCDGQTDSLGDGCLATSAEVFPAGVAVDGAGNLFITDSNNNNVRKVTVSTGIITTVAGSGIPGYSGDGGPATSAELYAPMGVAVDSAGNIYIGDSYNNRVRKVGLSGNIASVAGSGPSGANAGSYSGDGGAATSAELSQPRGVALDNEGNLYIADVINNRIRRVSVTATALSFASTAVGRTSSDSPQVVALENVGNQPLYAVAPGFTVPGPNFVQVAGTGTVANCTSSFALMPGADCNISISFTPTTSGSISGAPC